MPAPEMGALGVWVSGAAQQARDARVACACASSRGGVAHVSLCVGGGVGGPTWAPNPPFVEFLRGRLGPLLSPSHSPSPPPSSPSSLPPGPWHSHWLLALCSLCRIEVDHVRVYTHQLLKALEYMHNSKVVHR